MYSTKDDYFPNTSPLFERTGKMLKDGQIIDISSQLERLKKKPPLTIHNDCLLIYFDEELIFWLYEKFKDIPQEEFIDFCTSLSLFTFEKPPCVYRLYKVAMSYFNYIHGFEYTNEKDAIWVVYKEDISKAKTAMLNHKINLDNLGRLTLIEKAKEN